MEVDIDLIVRLVNQDGSAINSILPSAYKCKSVSPDEGDTASKISIRYSDEKDLKVQSNAGVLIEQFLNGLHELSSMIATGGGEIRLGIFYDLKETIVFPVYLSRSCIKLMSQFNLSLDSTGYPCDDEEN